VKDYYTILGLPRRSTNDDIKKAYRKLALVYHPDRNADPGGESVFKEINEAYETLGDPDKRRVYDQRLENPFAEFLQQAPQPKHKDPAYRRRTPGAPPRGSKLSETAQLMHDYIHYVRWMCWAGLLFSSVLFIDYILPYKIVDETVQEVYSIRGRRGVSHYVVVTESDKKIKVYPDEARNSILQQEKIKAAYSMIYSTRMWLSEISGDHKVTLAYIYRALMLFPLILFVTSVCGLVFKEKVEFSFNASIVSGVFIFIILIFL
jgi:hypothetical protein